MDNNFDTIVAQITPIALGAVGIIRISGDNSYEIASQIFSKLITPQKINYGYILDNNGEKIDEVILLPFVAPHSYTGENVIEIQTHGNPAIINTILELILSKGARIAQRGEFTKRAFLNHRIDLSQAEAVLDIINSKNMKSARNALNNLSGALTQKITEIKDELIKLYSKVIASIDFPEDVAEVETDYIVSICNDNIFKINNILKNVKSHDFIKDGFNVSLIGKPNVGKSSLFNAILSYNRSIVTAIEGTTRDTIKETINIDGFLINFVDTAGIRDKNKADIVEKIGIDNSIEAIKMSDIVLFLYEDNISEINQNLIELAYDKDYFYIRTKADLNNSKNIETDTIEISSKTGFGIDKLKDKILSKIKELVPENLDYTINKRHQTCLIRCLESLQNVIETSKLDDLADLYANDLKMAIMALDEITGEVLTDKILDNIFDNFCIGK